MASVIQHQTLPAVARQLGITARRVEFAVAKFGIQPAFRVGTFRMFDAEAVEKIRAAVESISSRREVAHA